MYNDFSEMREEARQHIIDELADYTGYGCDFHNYAFNEDYYECYTDKAIEQLEEMGVFNCLGKIQEYEKDTFGELYTDLSNPCNVLNMMWYIIGDEELYSMFENCDLWDELWNDDISEENIKQLIKWLKENNKI